MQSVTFFIVPVFNAEVYISDFFDKVVSLVKNRKISFIFIDDGSSDASHDILKKKCKDFKNCKLFSLEANFGQSYARNYGIKIAKEIGGVGIGFLDIDDYVSENFFECIDSWNGESVIVTDFKATRNDEIIDSGFESLDDFNEISSAHYLLLLSNLKATFSSCNKIFPLAEINFYIPGSKEEDTLHSFDFFSSYEGLVLKKNNYVYYYSQNEGSSTRILDYRVFDSIYVSYKIKEIIANKVDFQSQERIWEFFSSFVIRHRLKNLRPIKFFFYFFIYLSLFPRESLKTKFSLCFMMLSVYIKNILSKIF